MAPRSSFWKGYLKLSLVTCRVSMTPATTDSEKIRFRTLNRPTLNPVVSRYVDSRTGKPVEDADQVRGYAQTEDDHVIFEDEELDQVALDSTRTISIDNFVPAGSIGAIWRDMPHFLVPDDQVGAEAFAVIRDAMAASGTAGIARLVLYRRERAVMLVPDGRGIVVWTLRFGDEVRPSAGYFDDLPEAKADPRLMTLMRKLIAERTGPWSPDLASDPVQDRMVAMIAARQKGRKPAGRPRADSGPAGSGKVVSIMDALRRSLEKGRK